MFCGKWLGSHRKFTKTKKSKRNAPLKMVDLCHSIWSGFVFEIMALASSEYRGNGFLERRQSALSASPGQGL
ncbi:hypothetical protein [Reyranella sp.]|jgi:hypothetical protein|uniref:hypothetical protein n=1 Tax=Reyranella sp. TaxID=1929291 RepID=UPI002F922816